MVAVKILKCGVVGILGVLVLVLGLIAEHKRVKDDDGVTTTSDGKYCRIATTPAARLAVVAALLVLVANAYGGCGCCCQKNLESRATSKKICAILCLVFSWILALYSFLVLLVLGIENSSIKCRILALYSFLVLVVLGIENSSIIRNTKNNGRECPIPPAGGLASGAVLGLIAAILGVMLCPL